MGVKEHYDNHLGYFYSWMIGDLNENKNGFLDLCKKQNLHPLDSKIAIDLGAGNGIQSIALAELGFSVIAIDFNQQLLSELDANKKEHQILTINSDLRNIIDYRGKNAELIICCGDTITHLDSTSEISKLISDVNTSLAPKGKFILSFRDYSMELTDTKRFIPVKSDSDRILTCFLEYFDRKVRVTDILYEKESNNWQQKISSYEKIRISKNMVLEMLIEKNFDILMDDTLNGMITIIGEKKN
jgi:SAM-dependent methyltransferase